MSTYDSFATTWGDPLLLGIVVISFCVFTFKMRKMVYGVGSIILGAIAYYVMHNGLAVLKMFEPLVKKIFEFFTNFQG